MYWTKIKCYLCAEEAERLASYQNIKVKCEHCKTYYTFSSLIPMTRIDEETNKLLYRDFNTGEKHPLPSLERLSDYIKKRANPEGRFPFLITPQILDDLYNK